MSESDNDQVTGKPLLGEFPPHTYAMWRQAAEQLLKGAPFEKKLITPTYEGFDLQPIYHREDVAALPHMQDALPGQGLRVRGRRASGFRSQAWMISQELSASTPETLNAVLHHELMNGQNELNIWFDSASRAGIDSDAEGVPSVGICGVSACTLADYEVILEGVSLPAISVYLRAGAAPEAIAALFLAAAKKRGANLSELNACFEADPIAYLVEWGSLPGGLASALDGMAALTRFGRDHTPKVQTVVVQGHPYHNGGASSVQEIASVLSTGVYYLKELVARGLAPEEIAPRMRLALSIGSQYFVEIAKFRAVRLLWSRVLEAFGLPDALREVHLHARTGLWNKTLRDPYVNSLRTTTEAFAAVVGGVDSMHVGTFDECVREADEFSRRIARNVHHILAEECDMTRVIDPAGGSWAVEWLTNQMAGRAWSEFQKLEAAGGIVAALEAGDVQSAVKDTLNKKREALAQRKDTLVGTNNYPNVQEKALDPRSINYVGIATDRAKAVADFRETRDIAAVSSALARASESGAVADLVAAAEVGATLGELQQIVRGSEPVAKVTPILVSRGAALYENLADRVAVEGEKGTILQVNFGPSRRYRMRADWTSAFFRVAGFTVAADDDFLSIDDAVNAALRTPGRVALIVSDDATYAESVVDLARALKDARPDLRLILAGAPGEHEVAWREAGVDDFVHVRVNNYEFNDALAKSLEN